MLTSPLHSPQPLGSSPGMGVDASPGSRCLELRSRYSSTKDMLHTLFVCISGVADQLQTNFASDMRSILKTVFKIVCSQAEPSEEQSDKKEGDSCVTDAPRVADCPLCSSARHLPEWVPDSTCSQCSACRSPFTLLRRRHHCRSCGKIFCARCSPNTAVLPHYGQAKPVRVCTHCYTTHLPPTSRCARSQ
uniref:FYVE-type domain-containing protein n=3 Tax=Zosteropidae TaxID=36297 RepID=A0A8D2NZX8_ZOSLA